MWRGLLPSKCVSEVRVSWGRGVLGEEDMVVGSKKTYRTRLRILGLPVR